MGLYVLLSLLALIGLLIALSAELSESAAIQQTETVWGSLHQVRASLDTGEDPQSVISAWQQTLERDRQTLWLVDANCNTLTDGTVPPPADIALQSVVQSALRSGESKKRIRIQGEQDEVLAFALDLSQNVSNPRVLLTVIPSNALQRDFALVNSTASRVAIFTWLIGVVSAAFVIAGLVVPLIAMFRNLHQSTEWSQREEVLLSISDRQDEMGQVAASLHRMEEERIDQVKALESARREARASSDLMAAVLDSMVEGVVAIDLEQRIVFINTGARRLLGINQPIGVGHRLYEAVRVPAFLDTIQESLSTKKMQTLEYRSVHENSHLSLVVIPILKGPHAGAVAVVRDVSEMRQLEAMRRDFVSGVSHELKTPLTVIQACTDTLLGGALSDTAAAERFLTQINEQSERLLQLIIRLLQLARVESGQQVLHFEKVDIVAIARESLRGFQTIADSRNISLVLNGPNELPILADDQALQTVICNLVDNALKHSQAGNVVTVELSACQTFTTLVVRDTGSGIPEELLGRIFERFYRVERDRSRERGGSGLGLAIVKHLCQAIGATVSVKSSLGVGSEFTVQFPQT